MSGFLNSSWFLRRFCRVVGPWLLGAWVGAMVVGTWQSQVYADFVVAPNIYANAPGPGGNSRPIATSPQTIQMIFDANQLLDMRDHEISGITFRLSNAMPNGYGPFDTLWSEYEISIGQAVAIVDVGESIADNFVGNPQLVRSGPLMAPINSWPRGIAPNPSPWGLELVFDDPFIYRSGNLALLITHNGSDGWPGNNLLDSSGNSTPNAGQNFLSVAGNGFRNTTGTVNNFVPVTRFTVTAVAIPEPNSLLILVIATSCLYVQQRPTRH